MGKRGNGEGTIYKDKKNNRWIAQATIDGKRKSFYGKTRKEANEKLTKALSEVQRNVYIEPSKMKLSEWLDEWFNTYKKPSLKPKTLESYKGLIDLYIKPEIGNIILKDLRPEPIQKLYNKKSKEGLSPRTVKYIHTVLHGALKQAATNELIPRNYTEGAALPKQEKTKDIRILTQDEQKRFIDACKADYLGMAFILVLATGLRRGEILGLKWDDIDLTEGTLTVRNTINRIKDMESGKYEIMHGTPKTKAGQRRIPIPANVVEMLKTYKPDPDERKGLVFPSTAGTPIEPRNLNRKFYKLMKQANIEGVNLHALRHTYCSSLLKNGVQPNIVKELMGHSSITVTLNIYAHIMPEEKHEAVNKINDLF